MTYSSEELVATKLRAMFQRTKGRDLFDLWLALTTLHVEPSKIVDAFPPYRQEIYSAMLAETNLRKKVSRKAFREDLHPLVASWPEAYDIDEAAELIISKVLSLLPSPDDSITK